jgi:alpha-tubulin suppressor-like RCC1 family protein
MITHVAIGDWHIDNFLFIITKISMSFFFNYKKLTHVAIGHWHTAFVCKDGEAFTCGRGIEGQLGFPDVDFCLFPQRVHQASSFSKVRSMVTFIWCRLGR